MEFKELEQDKKVFRELRRVLTRGERLWLLDCDGDYKEYQRRLHIFANDYKISNERE